jgi:serine/threonine protein kinase
MPCPDDNTLAELMQGLLSGERRREVEEHVDTCATCTSLLVGVGHTLDHGEDLPAGAKLGRYEVIEPIGRGAMGVVYAAKDTLLARMVALKVLHRASSPERALEEARALARLAHPNVVSVFDAGEDDGRLYLAMQRVTGTTLGAWLRVEVRPWREIVDVFLQAGWALTAAHAAGVVHGDFKPDNVIVQREGAEWKAYVTDFGLARLVSLEAESSVVVAGTPAYMAPEQLEGASASPASDQFAFATAFHEALYGARPYSAATPSDLRSLMRHPRVLAAPPDTRGVPSWVFPILARGVEIDARFRHASVEAMCAQVERKLAGNVHYAINATMQLGLWVFHAAITTLFMWAIVSSDSPSSGTPTKDHVRTLSTVIALWLAALFFFGWGPIGVLWTPINAYGLFRKRRWALTSTLVYSAFSLFTCIGTPFAVYAVVSLWPLRRNRATSNG